MRLALTGAIVAIAVSLATPEAAGAAPTCAEGPETIGNTIYGTPCDDTIRPPRAVTVVHGEGGDDTIYGGRGNDRLHGGPGEDRLYGGIGDDELLGGPDDDLLSGGFGADTLDGEGGDDHLRGDATIDAIADSGGGADTLSFATGVTPGFPNEGPAFEIDGFPAGAEGRGVYVDLVQGFANDGIAANGGGVDLGLVGADFEIVIGTAFPDYIVGTASAETIYGGGGADVLLGGGGGDTIHGGAEGDSCDGASVSGCESEEIEVEPRDPGAIAVGLMAPGNGRPALYLTGGADRDAVVASYSANAVSFELLPDSDGAFDTDPATGGGCAAPAAGKVVCPLGGSPPDSVVLAGLGGDDELETTGFPVSTSIVLLGGSGEDELRSGDTEDALVDGTGADTTSAGGGDDALPNNPGGDDVDAGPGDDLVISASICEGDRLDGGGGRDNAQWAQFKTAGVSIDMNERIAGLIGDDGRPDCGDDPPTFLAGFEDLEGSDFGDVMVGDAEPNQLLGRLGPDVYLAGGGNDSLLANSGDSDPVIDCGEGWDTAQVDFPEFGDAAPVACESIFERKANSFRPPDTPPDPDPDGGTGIAPPVPPAEPGEPVRDRTRPRTALRHRPPAVLTTSRRRRQVAFAFLANEPARFRCKLDSRPWRSCRSPQRYRLARGRHSFRVFAVDLAGNRDRSPAQAVFAIRSPGRR